MRKQPSFDETPPKKRLKRPQHTHKDHSTSQTTSTRQTAKHRRTPSREDTVISDEELLARCNVDFDAQVNNMIINAKKEFVASLGDQLQNYINSVNQQMAQEETRHSIDFTKSIQPLDFQDEEEEDNIPAIIHNVSSDHLEVNIGDSEEIGLSSSSHQTNPVIQKDPPILNDSSDGSDSPNGPIPLYKQVSIPLSPPHEEEEEDFFDGDDGFQDDFAADDFGPGAFPEQLPTQSKRLFQPPITMQDDVDEVGGII